MEAWEKAKSLLAKIGVGYFKSQEVIDPEASALNGGVIARPPFVAASLNSTTTKNVNIKFPMRADVHEDINFAWTGVIPLTNSAPQFQYVQGAGYAGVMPWEQQPEVPISRPWE